MLKQRGIALVLLLILLAGCTSPPQEKQRGEPTTSADPTKTSSSSFSTTATPSESPPIVPETLSLTDCQGIGVRFVWPADSAPIGGEVPPGWERTMQASTDDHLKLVECGRASIGPFERGPIHFLLETHEGVNPPAECRDFGSPGLGAEVIRTIWFDDEEIVSYVASHLAMPAHLGIFTYEKTDVPDYSLRKWTWHEPDGPVSELTYSRLEGPTGGGTLVKRLFWHDGQAASFMDWEKSDQQPLATPGEVVGWLRSPMMYAESGVELYSSELSTLVDPGGAFTGTIQRFGDLQCKEPLP